ncbi:N-acetylmuramoyl-L-alanine amidase [Streptomyces sp. SID4985]|uniref:N-acetylmuramoyl-L-alanine amidase n=1 Tax=Streptomyces sp. SID4985 TaxID=2690292 RepID=UPI00137218AC|nr:N-acetylmuramoyl-L-alanine amidase [Streptomyces sp. SID4985]
MSYAGPEFEPPTPRRSRRRPLTVTLAALVPVALLGWAAYAHLGRPGGDAHATGTASPSVPAPGFGDGKDASPSASALPLKGKVVVIDPGHNPGNFRHTAEIARQVNVGNGHKECDTTGTETNAGYPEAKFTLDVSHRVRALLEKQGATVKFTHDEDGPAWGPCVDERAGIGNRAHADAALSIHADGSAPGNRGFHVILPGTVHAGGADTRPITGPSRDLGKRVAAGYRHATGEPFSNYLGDGTGLVTRTDLGGLNLSTVPKVFIECGNMRDATDAAELTSASWRQKAAQGISEGIVSFLRES